MPTRTTEGRHDGTPPGRTARLKHGPKSGLTNRCARCAYCGAPVLVTACAGQTAPPAACCPGHAWAHEATGGGELVIGRPAPDRMPVH